MSPLATAVWFAIIGLGAGPGGTVEIPSAVLRSVDQVEVPAREFGPLASVNVRPGDRVEADQLLVQIVDAEPLLELARARLKALVAAEKAKDDVDLRFARKSHEVERAELRRVQEGLQRLPGSISAAELDQLKLAVDRAELAVEQTELTLRLAKMEADVLEQEVLIAERQVERRRIVSPINGVVMEVKRHKGEWVEPGQTVVRVLGLEQLQAEVFVDARHAERIRAEDPVTLSIKRPDGTVRDYRGRVTFVAQEIDPVNKQVLVWAAIDNSSGELRAGASGRLVITVRE